MAVDTYMFGCRSADIIEIEVPITRMTKIILRRAQHTRRKRVTVKLSGSPFSSASANSGSFVCVGIAEPEDVL